MNGFDITRVSVTSLRGYRKATLELNQPFRVLVGPNNQGKSSILKLCDFLLNSLDEDAALSKRKLTKQELAFLMPANNERRRARRLTLDIQIDDGRVRKKYERDDRVCLRMSVKKSNSQARLNLGKPRRGEKAEEKAWGLLCELRNNIAFQLIPAARDADAARFSKAFRQHIDSLLLQKMQHHDRGGAPSEYRQAKKALRGVRDLVNQTTDSFWESMKEALPGEMAQSIEMCFDGTPESLAKWVEAKVSLGIATGEHDCETVSASEVGNGLQSLLDVAMTLSTHPEDSEKALFLAIEEPEAFLHPSAQRDVAFMLRKRVTDSAAKIIVTTHSPVILEETKYGEVALVQGQQFYNPSVVNQKRDQINTTLMAAENGETFFADAVVLVEGPGDKAFLDTLLRRLRSYPNGEKLSSIHVQYTGGKRCFAPWIRLLKSYGQRNDRPIDWLCLFDADAVAKEGGERAAIRGLREAGYSVPTGAPALGDLGYDEVDARAAKADEINEDFAELKVRFFSVDLEWAICNGDWGPTRDCLDEIVGQHVSGGSLVTRIDYARKLGSKVKTGSTISHPLKQPYLRAKIASKLSCSALSAEMEQLLKDTLELVMSEEECAELWDSVVEQ